MKEERNIDAHGGNGRWFRRALILVLLPLCFRTFQFLPGMSYVQEVWFALCFLGLVFVYPYLKIRSGLVFSHFEIYLILMVVVTVSLTTRQAHAVFGQPASYGILSQRDLVLLGVWLVLLHLLRVRLLNVADIEVVLLTLAWLTFALYVAMRICLSPSDFLAYGEGFVTRPMIGVEPAFKLQEFFILFGVFYYALLGIRTRRSKYYLAAAILFPVTLGASGRGILIGVLLTLLCFLFMLRGTRQAVIASVKFFGVTSVLLLLAYVVSPATLNARMRGFSDALSASTGSATQDPSANARIIEIAIALPYIAAHPFLGNGIVSHQWQGGSETAMGAYFFASDIGIFGILFSYGLLGLFLYAWQYRSAWSVARQIPDSLNIPLLDAIKAFLLYSAIYSLESGMFVWSANVTLFFVVLLFGISAQVSTSDPAALLTGGKCSPTRHALSA